MALTLRLTKGSPLSHQELDDNFTYLSGSLTDSNTLLSGSFPADRLIVSADSASATAGGVTTNSQLRTYDGNTSILIGGSQGSFGVNGLGMLIKEDQGSGDHVILSDGSGSHLRLRAGGGDVGDSYVMIQADQAGFADEDIFTVAKFGGPNKGTELYHSGSLVFFTDELSGDKSVYISGSLSGSKDVYFPALPNTTTPHIVGFDSASGQLTYYSTASFGGGSSTDTGSLMLTGSVSNNTLTFTKGDGSIFSLTVDTGSGAGGGSTDISALNTFTGSAENRLSSIEAATGSYLTATPTLDAVTTVGNTTNNNITVSTVNASIGKFTTQVTSSQIGVNADNTNARFEVGGDSWQAGRVHFPKLKTVTTDLKLVAIQTGSLGGFGELTHIDYSTFLQPSDTGSFLYSGSYNSAASAITLYSADSNYTLDLSGLAGGGGGFPITASNEGSDLTNSMSKIDFVGNAVTATSLGSIVTVTINTGSAASATDITDLNNFTGSANLRLDSLEAATGSYLTGADTGSFYVASSVNNATITFTQGDGTTEQVTVNNVVNATNADNIALTADSTNTNRYVPFTATATGDGTLLTDAGLLYNPSSNILTATTFNGALTGNADTATSATTASYAATSSYANETDVTYATDSTPQTTTRVVHVAGTANAVNGTSTTTSPVMSVLSGKTLGTDAFFTATWLDNQNAGQQSRPIAIETISGSNQLVFTVDSMTADVADAIMFQGVVFV